MKLWRNKRPPADFAAEIESHLALEADRLREQTAAPDPEGAARRAFGNITAIQEATYERRRWIFFDHLWQDFQHALRMMRQQPGFSAVVILTLALGVGANTAIFSLIDSVLLRPLPFQDPGRLAMLWTDDVFTGDHESQVSLPDFADWKSLSSTFEDMTVFGGQTFLLGTDGSPERSRSARVPANFFSVLGVRPLIGRVFSADEEKRAEHVIVISYALWQRRFAGSPQALDADLVMDGKKSRIIGVMPGQFQFPFPDTQVWEPITAHPYWAARDHSSQRANGYWYALGRVKSEVSWVRAQADMDLVAKRLQAEYPESDATHGIRIVPLHAQTTGPVERPLAVLFGAVFLLLLIACINVANLLLARGTVREREFVLRRTLGAGRWRIIAQLLTESLVLAATGGIIGLLLARFGLQALIAFGPQDFPRLNEARLDGHVLLFTVAASIFVAVVSGLWPIWQSSASTARSRQWTTVADRGVRRLLLIGEFTLALTLLAGAGLLLRSFALLQAVNPGFRPENLLIMRIDLHVGKTKPQQVAYFQEAIELAASMPGVRSAAGIGRFLKSYGAEPVSVEGRVAGHPVAGFRAAGDIISGPFFETGGIPLRAGRVFSQYDNADSPPVAIINETMAHRFWPNENPVGKRFRFSESNPPAWITVVGVSGDTHRHGLENQEGPQVFRPLSQSPDNELDLLVRTDSDPLIAASSIRDAIQSIDKTVAKFGVTTVEHALGGQTAERRFQTTLLGLFAMLALFLAAIGIYGLIHHSVAQRTHEIGVRMALGARNSAILGMVFNQGLRLAGLGVLTGLLCAFALTRFLASLLYGISPTDPVTFLVAPSVLLIVAALACWLPARRAARVDPMRALRED
jgi:predicted permease